VSYEARASGLSSFWLPCKRHVSARRTPHRCRHLPRSPKRCDGRTAAYRAMPEVAVLSCEVSKRCQGKTRVCCITPFSTQDGHRVVSPRFKRTGPREPGPT